TSFMSEVRELMRFDVSGEGATDAEEPAAEADAASDESAAEPVTDATVEQPADDTVARANSKTPSSRSRLSRRAEHRQRAGSRRVGPLSVPSACRRQLAVVRRLSSATNASTSSSVVSNEHIQRTSRRAASQS